MIAPTKRQSSFQSRYLLEKTTNVTPSSCTCHSVEVKPRSLSHLGHSWFFGSHRAPPCKDLKQKLLCKKCTETSTHSVSKPEPLFAFNPTPPVIAPILATATNTINYSRSSFSDGEINIYIYLHYR